MCVMSMVQSVKLMLCSPSHVGQFGTLCDLKCKKTGTECAHYHGQRKHISVMLLRNNRPVAQEQRRTPYGWPCSMERFT
jgi:hypothetical protein